MMKIWLMKCVLLVLLLGSMMSNAMSQDYIAVNQSASFFQTQTPMYQTYPVYPVVQYPYYHIYPTQWRTVSSVPVATVGYQGGYHSSHQSNVANVTSVRIYNDNRRYYYCGRGSGNRAFEE